MVYLDLLFKGFNWRKEMNTDLRVLVIDDMMTMRKIVSKHLKSLGFTDLQEADDGLPAWDLLEKNAAEGNPIQFIVSDWNMPGMTGMDLLKKVRADDRFKSLPFLMVTAEGEKENIVAAVQAGVSNYIVKPFNLETLQSKVAAILK